MSNKFEFTGDNIDQVQDLLHNYCHNGLQLSQFLDRLTALINSRQPEIVNKIGDEEKLKSTVQAMAISLKEAESEYVALESEAASLRSELDKAKERIKELEGTIEYMDSPAGRRTLQ